MEREKVRFGTRDTFSIEIVDDEHIHSDIRTVDAYAAGIRLTCDDNHVFVPQYLKALTVNLDWLLNPTDRDILPFHDLTPIENHRRLLEIAKDDNTQHLYHRFMDWGPTTDNVRMHYFRDGYQISLPFSFWRKTHWNPEQLGTVFCATMLIDELRSTLHRAAWKLMWDWSSLKRNSAGEPWDARKSLNASDGNGTSNAAPS